MKVISVLCALVGLSAALSKFFLKQLTKLLNLNMPPTQTDIPGSDIFSGWEGRIVGGSNAVAGQFPYQASLRTADDWHFCGGWIHNPRWIVSAAHCTTERLTTNTFVVVGALSRTTGGIRYDVSAIVDHPNYNANTLANDISVVQTSDTITFNANVASIPLSTVDTGVVVAVASGWGLTSVSFKISLDITCKLMSSLPFFFSFAKLEPRRSS